DFAYNGALLTKTTADGTVVGNVGYIYDNDFRLTSLTVNGANPITFSYDADGLLTQAGALLLTRDAQNGLLVGTTLGGVSDRLSYNGFGEIASYTAMISGTSTFAVQFTRDKLGRVMQKSETVGGVTHAYDYRYDLAGRLEEVKQDGSVTASYTYDSNGNRLTG